MKWIGNYGVLVSVALLSSVLITEAQGSSPAAQDDRIAVGEALVARSCNVCHGLDRVATKRAPPEEWRKIIDRMIARGAQVTPSESDAIVAYLSAAYGKNSVAKAQ